jgi:hypothetical protein
VTATTVSGSKSKAIGLGIGLPVMFVLVGLIAVGAVKYMRKKQLFICKKKDKQQEK